MLNFFGVIILPFPPHENGRDDKDDYWHCRTAFRGLTIPFHSSTCFCSVLRVIVASFFGVIITLLLPPSQNLFPILATLFNSRALDRRRFRGGGRGGLVGGGDISNGIDQAFHSKHVARQSKLHVQVCRFTLKKTCSNPHLEKIVMREWKQG